MPIQIQAPDGSIAEFPDGMPDAQIQSVMQREYPPAAQGAPQPPQQPQAAPSSFFGRMMTGIVDPFLGMVQNSANIGGVNPLVDSLAAQEPEKYGMQQHAAAQMVNQAVTDREKNYDAARQAAGSSGLDVARTLGNALSPAIALYGAVSLPSGLATAATSGGAYGFNQPVANVQSDEDFSKGRLEDTGLGIAGGTAGYGAGKLASALLNPVYSTAKQTLLSAGVPLTMGQTLGGVAQTAEDALGSVPVLGDFIKNRQRDAVVGFNRAAINRTLQPIGESLPEGKVGHEAVEYASDKLGDAYEALLPNLSATADQQLGDDIGQIVAGAKSKYLLPDAQAKQLTDIVDSQITGKSDNGFYDGDALKNVQSVLGKKARGYLKSADTDQQSLGDALMDVRSTFNNFIARQNPDQAETLTSINQGFANFARVRQAAAGATKDGVFTPAQLAQAVRGQATTQGQAAIGHALMQDLSGAGKEVLPSTVPDSGTPLRHSVELAAALLAGHGAGIELPEWATGLGTAAAGGIGVGSALYSPQMQSLIRAGLTKRPDVARRLGSALMAYPGILGTTGGAIGTAAAPMAQNVVP